MLRCCIIRLIKIALFGITKQPDAILLLLLVMLAHCLIAAAPPPSAAVLEATISLERLSVSICCTIYIIIYNTMRYMRKGLRPPWRKPSEPYSAHEG
jgi:hypothetical protein